MVDSKHTYADLDELIVNHVQAMARKVEELMAHDRFKAGTEDELRGLLPYNKKLTVLNSVIQISF